MTMGKAMRKWTGNGPVFEAVSELHDDGGITGLKMVTDDNSVMMNEYIKLPNPLSEPGPSVTPEWKGWFRSIKEDIQDEIADYNKYMAQSQTSERMGRPDIALILQIIAREEKNHHEILEALISSSDLQPGSQGEYDQVMGDRETRMAHIHDIAIKIFDDLVHLHKNRNDVTQEAIDAWLRDILPGGEVFTDEEHREIRNKVWYMFTP